MQVWDHYKLIQSGDNKSMIDYLMVRKTDRCLVNDVKLISSEVCVPQHQMIIGSFVIRMKPHKKNIVKFVPKPRIWKLLDFSFVKWQIELRLGSGIDMWKRWLPNELSMWPRRKYTQL